uniref:Uncharacterized protein n=1 Tax=Cacopsylla melanoneura TaxID=428564 RepID=A0A8D8QV09_9HEMI
MKILYSQKILLKCSQNFLRQLKNFKAVFLKTHFSSSRPSCIKPLITIINYGNNHNKLWFVSNKIGLRCCLHSTLLRIFVCQPKDRNTVRFGSKGLTLAPIWHIFLYF